MPEENKIKQKQVGTKNLERSLAPGTDASLVAAIVVRRELAAGAPDHGPRKARRGSPPRTRSTADGPGRM